MAAVLVLALALAASGAGRAAAAAEEASAPSDWDMFANGLQVLWGAYDGCARGAAGDVAACLKLRALRSAERALRAERLPLLGGLAFVRAQGRDGRGLADDEPPPLDEAALPADAAAKQRALDEALLDRVARFFKGHSLQLDEARLLEDDGAGDEGEQGAQDGEDGAVAEGRKKKGFKKYGGALLLGLMMKGGLMAMAWKGVALMAGKALMVAKIALVLSAVVALKKLSHGGHGEEKVY
ncbi:Uncharacterized protein GBIM_13890 [Gryllus bimaculatus]|nr:Uncharacterized protein GBIM_13890 [Gryllus bimaculatus]